MIDKNLITTQKNLLAFSGGVDSTALFFLLLKQNIPFDICIVNYHQREQSKLEVAYANKLAQQYNKQCFLFDYDEEKFNEKLARDFRYKKFNQIINENSYESLITAHQLNDNFEWFLMQLSKGSGLSELIGLQAVEQRENFLIYRPLVNISKEELLLYLQTNNLQYFIDETNHDPKYKRNFFRKEFSDNFIQLYKDGLIKSLNYLKKDIDSLIKKDSKFSFEELSIFKINNYDENIIIRNIDKELKKRGILISQKTREEILNKRSVVVSHKVAVEITTKNIWIAPYTNNPMDKTFKEKCRVAKIPKNIRPYLYSFSQGYTLPQSIFKVEKENS